MRREHFVEQSFELLEQGLTNAFELIDRKVKGGITIAPGRFDGDSE